MNTLSSLSRAWSIVIGILLMFLGVLAIAIPVVATVQIAWLLGVVLIVSGIVQLIDGFRLSKERGRGWGSRCLLAGISLIAGIIMIRNPIAGAIGLTFTLAFYLLAGAVGKAVVVFEHPGVPGRGWLVFSSLVSLFLGIYLLATLPISSLVVPGTILGVDLIFFGISLIVFTGESRSTENVFEAVPPRERSAS